MVQVMAKPNPKYQAFASLQLFTMSGHKTSLMTTTQAINCVNATSFQVQTYSGREPMY
jgi:hypothetical protein